VDYKTIASAVARLYQEGKISQDKDGKLELEIATSRSENQTTPTKTSRLDECGSLRVLCDDQRPNQYDNDGNMVSNVGCRAWTNADGNREYPDQRAEKRECLAGQSGRTCRRRPDPSRYRGREKHECDHAFGDAGLSVFVSGDQHPRMDEGSNDKSRSLDEQGKIVGHILLGGVRERRR
jgi:hypothetical protein